MDSNDTRLLMNSFSCFLQLQNFIFDAFKVPHANLIGEDGVVKDGQTEIVIIRHDVAIANKYMEKIETMVVDCFKDSGCLITVLYKEKVGAIELKES